MVFGLSNWVILQKWEKLGNEWLVMAEAGTLFGYIKFEVPIS